VAELLASISSQELTEWGLFFEWREARREEDQQWRAEVAKAERYVNEGK
jgi:hypothetical protein